MGTTYLLKYAPTADISPDSVKEQTDSLLKAINQEMSTYDSQSSISLFNALRTTEQWYHIPPRFFTVLTHALDLAKFTQGAFDPTLGPLVNLWGFGPGGKTKVPNKEDIARTLLYTGYKKVDINKETRSIRKQHPSLYLDLSAIAKGWAVDEVGRLLKSLGINDYMVEIGGEIKLEGNRTWAIGITHPNPSGKNMASRILHLKTGALATSGDYSNHFTKKDARYSHIINYKTGEAMAHKLSGATIFDPQGRCFKADALATAFMSMGPTKAQHFAKKHSLAAYLLYRDQKGVITEWASEQFQEIMKRK